MYSTEIVLDTATIRGKLKLKLTEILRPEKHRITHHHSAELQTTKQTLATSKHSNEFTYSDFPCHLKVNLDKLAPSYRRWKCKKGKRLTITANFQERNLGTALSGKKIRPLGRIVKNWTGYERVISQSDA